MAAPPALGGPAARPDPVETLQEEAICAICLDYFSEPVSIGCGHNFCRACISRLWARPGADGTPDTPAGAPPGPGEDEEELEEEEDELDVEQDEEEEEEEEEGGVEGEEEEDDEMWEEEEEEEEDAELWEDPEEEEDEEEDEEGAAAWSEGARGGLYFGEEDFEDVMEEDVEEEGEEEEDEEDEEEEEEAEGRPPQRGPGAFTCPQCRQSFGQRSFRPNRQLANMVSIIRQLHPRPQRGPGPAAAPPRPRARPLCLKHQEPLKLFCEVGEAAICVVCREARGHKHHSVVPLDEVVQDCKNKLQSHLEPLRKQLETVLRQKSSEEEKISLLRDQMQAELQELEADFEVLHRFLAAEQVSLQRQLRERHEALLGRQRRNLSLLEERAAALGRLIAEAEAAARQDGLQLLKDIKSTFIRCENIKFQEPEMVPVDVGKKFRNCFLQDVVMRKMEKVFSKVPQADVTLDPSTAHPRLCLSLDRRSVRLGERRPEPPGGVRSPPGRGDGDLCVLGCPGFSAGRHYWEVEVGGRRGWAVGAARESARPRHKGGSAGPPKREIWAVGTTGKKYQALTATEQTALAPGEQPRRFGVYLDYERGQLCFYNAESMSHIHTFHICCRERVFPFFRILAKGTRIKICT
ncbi:E3 ubiquitin-protein ligase TRIM41 [Myiozetetes cayanensis]|uniref:E3 ubiquitin-protein ligase TRIM41 n=1 Tax=Myiozetetes cayanensis TaxID=478635 RepID=UPI00215F49D3|nr:E3 ubiquitin-protein ligase TRIM41 [Myiozetetes cayanensis]